MIFYYNSFKHCLGQGHFFTTAEFIHSQYCQDILSTNHAPQPKPNPYLYKPYHKASFPLLHYNYICSQLPLTAEATN